MLFNENIQFYSKLYLKISENPKYLGAAKYVLKFDVKISNRHKILSKKYG